MIHALAGMFNILEQAVQILHKLLEQEIVIGIMEIMQLVFLVYTQVNAE